MQRMQETNALASPQLNLDIPLISFFYRTVYSNTLMSLQNSLNIVAFLGLLLSEIARQYGRFAIAKPIGGVVCFILLRIQRPLLSDLYKSLAMPYIC